MSNTSDKELEIVFENIVPASGTSVSEKGKKSSPAINIPRVSVEQAQKIKSDTSEYLKLQIGQLKTKYAIQSGQKRQLEVNHSSLKFKSVKNANGIARKDKIDQIRCSEKDSVVHDVSSTKSNGMSGEANESKAITNVCAPTDNAEKNDSIVHNIFTVTPTTNGEANISSATSKLSDSPLGGKNCVQQTIMTQSKTSGVGNEFVIQSEFTAPSSTQNVGLGKWERKRQLEMQHPNLKLKCVKYANEITRENKTDHIHWSENDNTVVQNVSPTASDRTNQQACESKTTAHVSLSPDHLEKNDMVDSIFPLTPIKTSGEVNESNATTKFSASPFAGKNYNVLHNAVTQSKTNGVGNEFVVQSQLSVSSSTQQNIKLSRELSKRPNKFCINGSPASSPKNSSFYSNGKNTPKSGNHTSPLTFMRSRFGKKKSPDAKSVKRKLNFSNGSLGSQEGDSFSLDKNPLDGETQSLSQMDLENNDAYLLRQLKLHVHTVVEDNKSQTLLNDEEIDTIKRFFRMNSGCNDLYARMHNRKYKWTRLSDVRYDSATVENVHILQEDGFFVTDMQNVGMVCLLDLLKFPEVKELCKSLGIKCSVQNKKSYSEEIIRYCQQQRTINLNLQVSTSEEVVREKIKKILGLCFKLSPEPRGLFRRIHLLFNLNFNRNEQSRYGSQDLFEIQFVGTEKALYPKCSIDKTAKIFASRDDLLRFQIAEDLKAEFFLVLEAKDWNKAETILCTVRSNFLAECGALSVYDESASRVPALDLPLSLRKFTPGAVYAYILSEGVDVWKKIKKREEAINDLSLLLDQTVYLPYIRGRWYEKLITIYRTAGQLKEVAKTICVGMNDPHTDDQSSYVMSTRCREILKRKKGVQLEVKAMLRDIPLFTALASVEPTEVKACALDGKTGYKRVYIQEDETGDGKTYSSVEELVRSHYCPRIYKHGMHAENSLVSSLFGILFWDVIYEYHVPSAFISPYQTRPLDLNTGEFYKNRKTIIDAKLVEMSKWTDDDIASWVKEIYNKQYGKSSMVYWKWFRDSKPIMDIIICIGLEIILQICERFAKKYRGVRSGFPDLFLWTPGQKGQYKFVEVKGPNDRLATNQKLWLDFLVKINANVEVCFVQVQGSKSTKSSTGVKPCSPKNGDLQGGMETIEAGLC